PAGGRSSMRACGDRLPQPGVWFFGATPSGWRVGGFGGVAFGTALQPMTGGAHALQLVFGVGVGLGFDVVAVGRGPYPAELADRVAGEHLAADGRPVRRQPALAVAALPASGHGRLLFVGAAF